MLVDICPGADLADVYLPWNHEFCCWWTEVVGGPELLQCDGLSCRT